MSVTLAMIRYPSADHTAPWPEAREGMVGRGSATLGGLRRLGKSYFEQRWLVFPAGQDGVAIVGFLVVAEADGMAVASVGFHGTRGHRSIPTVDCHARVYPRRGGDDDQAATHPRDRSARVAAAA